MTDSGQGIIRMNSTTKIATILAAKRLKKSSVLAHNTATIAGAVAGIHGISQLQNFKQRSGPFLLLAASVSDALRLSRVRSTGLRQLAQQHWPGSVTLVFSARKGLPASCYHNGTIAVRVDAAPEVCYLAKEMGGLIISSSLNRRGKNTQPANRTSCFRLSRWLAGRIKGATIPSGKASSIYRIQGRKVKRLR